MAEALSKTGRYRMNASTVWGLGPPPWNTLQTYSDDAESTAPKPDRIPCVFNWNHGGHEVFVTGSFNDWSLPEKIRLTKSGNTFTAVEELQRGRHLYKFIGGSDCKIALSRRSVEVRPTVAVGRGR